jgi:hypothetical protein
VINNRAFRLVTAAFLALALTGAASPAGPVGEPDIALLKGANALEYVRVLTSEAFDSRRAGLEGGLKASAWIAEQFKAWGLEPAGTNGYFQDFKKPVSHVVEASFSAGEGKAARTFAIDEEWRVAENSGSADVTGEFVFAGYGIASEKAGWNDFAGLDLKGKIALMIAYGAPAALAGQDGPEMAPEAKIAKAHELGARAVVLMNAPVDVMASFQKYPFPAGAMLPPGKCPADMAVVGANDDAVKFLFRDSGMSLYTRIQRMNREKKTGSTPLGLAGTLKVRAESIPEAPCRNVLAKITGSDKALRNEVIVVGAHYDGLGRSEDGRMRPGADDNASGTAVIMELARAMKAGKARPKRTVVFALWDGEEQGLWGSVHYGANPVLPMDRTLVNLNLDMVGNGDGRISFRGVYYGPEVWDLLKASLPADMIKDIVPSRGGPGGSDHTPFLANGVPAFFLQTAGDHYGRHDAGDKFSLVDPALLEKTGLFVRAAVGVLADAKGLKAQTNGVTLNWLRSSLIVDLEPRDAGTLLKDAEAVTYPDLDFALVSVPGKTPLETAKGLFDLLATAKASPKGQLYKAQTSGFSFQRFGGERIGLLPGVTNLANLDGQDALLRLMGSAGLGFILVQDKDFADGGETALRMVAAANASGVLVIARMADGKNVARLIEASKAPGLLISEAPDAAVMEQMKPKRWRLAPIWTVGTKPEAYAATLDKYQKELTPPCVIAQGPKPAISGFAPEMIGLVSLIKPKVPAEREIIQGSLDVLGQNFINMLYEVRPMPE